MKKSSAFRKERGALERIRTVFRHLLNHNRLAVFSLVLILLFFLAMILAPVLTPYGENDMDLYNRLADPSAEHLLGTDESGRDILTRVLYGARVSLLIGVVPTLASMLLGAAMGMLAGYFGGKADTIIMRIADVTLAFPSILLAMVIMYTLGNGIHNVALTLVLVNWAEVARVVRAETLRLRNMEYITAARMMGVPSLKIILRHILPNCLPTLIVLFTLNVPVAIMTESSLSFLGLGIQPPYASWGRMVNMGRQFLYTTPWLCFAPGLAIMLCVLAFHFLGDGLRDALDPYQQRQ